MRAFCHAARHLFFTFLRVLSVFIFTPFGKGASGGISRLRQNIGLFQHNSFALENGGRILPGISRLYFISLRSKIADNSAEWCRLFSLDDYYALHGGGAKYGCHTWMFFCRKFDIDWMSNA